MQQPENKHISIVMSFFLILGLPLLNACSSDAMIITALAIGPRFPSEERIPPEVELNHLIRATEVDRMVIDPIYRNKQCPLVQAIRYGTAEQFREIIKLGADLNRCDGGADKLFYELLDAADLQRSGRSQYKYNIKLEEGFLEVFQEFKMRPIDAQKFLTEAARLRSVYGITYAIIDLRANPNHINEKTGETPLRSALEGLYLHSDQTIKTIEALVKLGADPETGATPSKSALAFARNINNPNLKARVENSMLQKNDGQ